MQTPQYREKVCKNSKSPCIGKIVKKSRVCSGNLKTQSPQYMEKLVKRQSSVLGGNRKNIKSPVYREVCKDSKSSTHWKTR